VRQRPPVYHKSDLTREFMIVKCRCGSYLSVPVAGVECPCGRRHIRKEELGEVRERVIGGEG